MQISKVERSTHTIMPLSARNHELMRAHARTDVPKTKIPSPK